MNAEEPLCVADAALPAFGQVRFILKNTSADRRAQMRRQDLKKFSQFQRIRPMRRFEADILRQSARL
jgi:hypothetical protein